MPAIDPSDVLAVRRFNRFYTRAIGALRRNFLDTPWSLAEMRVLFEIANGKDVTASMVGRALDLDAAYLSRLLQKFEKEGLVRRVRSAADARASHLSLTAEGRRQFTAANKRQIAHTTDMLARLGPGARRELVTAMRAIESLLAPDAEKRTWRLRDPEPGDLGWIVQRHGELYAAEYGWRGGFEGMCARIVSDFSTNFDPALEKGWIAEVNGARAGSVLLVKDNPRAKKADVARLRLLLVEPHARGLGIGRALAEACVAFARERGYRRVTLWTHKELAAARAIYAKLGFVKTGENVHHDWGARATSEFWDLDL